MIIFGWPIKVNWFLIFSQNIFNQSAGVSCSCLVMEVCLWLIGRAWLEAGVLGRPGASLSLADVTSSRHLIGQKWQALGARRLFHQWPRRRPGPGPPYSGVRQCEPLIGQQRDNTGLWLAAEEWSMWRQATWPTTGLAWTMGTRTLWESISDHRPPDIRLIFPTRS